MRIAIVVAVFPLLSETFVIRQICDLVDLGVDIDIIAFRPGPANALLNSDIEKYNLLQRTYYLSNAKFQNSKLKKTIEGIKVIAKTAVLPRHWNVLKVALNWICKGNFSQAKTLLEVFSKANNLPQYDAMLAHFGPTGVMVDKLQQLGIIKRVSTATIFHGFDMSSVKVIKKYLHDYKILFSSTDLLLPISDNWAKKLKEWGAPSEKIHVVHMGIDSVLFNQTDFNRDVHIPLRVLTVGRAVEKKGIIYGIKAIMTCDFPIEYRIIGEGELLDSLIKFVDKNCLQDKIKLLGAQPNTVVLENLKWADVFMLPSVTASNGDMEGIPVVLMESMAMGIITISTQHSGIPELVEDSVSGFLAPERDSVALAKYIKDIASGNINIWKIRKAARQKVENDFNSQLLAKKIIEIFSDFCKKDAYPHNSTSGGVIK